MEAMETLNSLIIADKQQVEKAFGCQYVMTNTMALSA